jgi:type IV pilus assembly protein PilC
MPAYRYVAKDALQNKVTGVIQAQTPQEVRITLRRQSLEVEKISRSWLNADLSVGSGKPKAKEVIIFTRMLAVLSGASVPIDQSLRALYDQAESPAMRKAIQRILIDVEGGESLTTAMRAHPKVFSPLYCNMVAAGERSGDVDKLLERLGDMLEKTGQIKAKVKSAMLYPTMVAVVMIAVTILMFWLVIPGFVEIFRESELELPLPTLVVMAMTDYVQNYWWTIPLYIGAVIALVRFLFKYKVTKPVMDRIMLKMPGVGEVVIKSAIARIARTLATLTASGVSILDALQLCFETSNNYWIQKALRDAWTAVSRGSEIAPPLRRSGIFPALVTNMIAAGEQAGEVDRMLNEVAKFYEQDVNNAVDGALKLIEPIMLILMAGMTMLIVAAVYMPLFSMITAIQ